MAFEQLEVGKAGLPPLFLWLAHSSKLTAAQLPLRATGIMFQWSDLREEERGQALLPNL
jgi:hypothetical protein